VLVLLDSGHMTQTQTVEFDDVPCFLAPVLLPKELASVDAANHRDEDDDSDDEVDLRAAQLPTALPPLPVTAIHPISEQPLVPSAAALPPGEMSSGPVAIHPQTLPGRPVRATRNKQPCYRSTSQKPHAHPAICSKQSVDKPGKRCARVRQGSVMQGITRHDVANSVGNQYG
jgi:hypothetical protein